MKAGGRLRFFATLISILAATVLVGGLVYSTTFQTLRKSYHQMLEENVAQGAYLLQNFVQNQYTILALYATIPSVQEGRFSEIPVWLKEGDAYRSPSPKRISIINDAGKATATTGETFFTADRAYFQTARDGVRNVSGPIVSRADGAKALVIAQPVPGHHPAAAVLTATVSLATLRDLLDSVPGLTGVELTLATNDGQILASTSGDSLLENGEIMESEKNLETVPWTIKARVRVANLLQPVRTVLFDVGLLVVFGVILVAGFLLLGIRLRRDRDQAREDRTQALRDAYEQIRKLAFYDTVTRLPNRNMVTRKIGEILQSKDDMEVVVVALDKFRSLTTTFGMHFGDLVLRETAARLSTFAPAEKGNFLGRLGGSEFVLLIPWDHFGPSTLGTVIDLFRAPMGRNDLKLQINVHLGACRLIDAGDSPENVIKSAETALWAAREMGPNEVSELTHAAVQKRLRRAQLQKLLPEAINRGELEIHYQPQVDMQTGTVAGYEALLRWDSPEIGSVCPMEFIPVAEETGIIVPLGYWVLDQALCFAKQLLADGNPSIVSVNVSPVQFLQHDFLDVVIQRVEASGIPARYIGLEITESTLMEGLDLLRPSLLRIMAMGIKLSLDDFGTGYSSLNYLKELPLHVLKIDKSFIDALDIDTRAAHLIECIIDLAHHLGLVVIAEGIETGRQHMLLAQFGCDLVQGYYTGRPQPARDHLERVVV